MIYQLNLPHPSQYLLDLVKKFADDTFLDPDRKDWLDKFHNDAINATLHIYTGDSQLTNQLQSEYSKFFTNPIYAVVGIMKNASNSQPACSPPHIDRKRALAINYYIELGGNNVTTRYYDAFSDTKSDVAQNYLYTEVNLVSQYVFEKNRWYAYAVNQCHSVENIDTTRYFLSIMVSDLPETYTVNDLISKNPDITFDKCELNLYN